MCILGGLTGFFTISQPGVTRLGRFFNPGVLKKNSLPFGAWRVWWPGFLVEGVVCGRVWCLRKFGERFGCAKSDVLSGTG